MPSFSVWGMLCTHLLFLTCFASVLVACGLLALFFSRALHHLHRHVGYAFPYSHMVACIPKNISQSIDIHLRSFYTNVTSVISLIQQFPKSLVSNFDINFRITESLRLDLSVFFLTH